MKPIPKNLLPDTLEVEVPIEGTYDGEYSEPRIINNVRYDARIMQEKGYTSSSSSGTIYVDSKNSAGAFEIPAGSRLKIIRGSVDRFGELSAVETVPYEDFNGNVHHWEVVVG